MFKIAEKTQSKFTKKVKDSKIDTLSSSVIVRKKEWEVRLKSLKM